MKKKKYNRKKRFQICVKYDYEKDPEIIYLLSNTTNKTALIRDLVREYYRDKVTIPF